MGCDWLTRAAILRFAKHRDEDSHSPAAPRLRRASTWARTQRRRCPSRSCPRLPCAGQASAGSNRWGSRSCAGGRCLRAPSAARTCYQPTQ
eukprot:1177518-Prorocentrum_minimum.AAC.2